MKYQQGDKVTFHDNTGKRTVGIVIRVNLYGFTNTVIVERDGIHYPRENHLIVLLSEWNKSNIRYGLPPLDDDSQRHQEGQRDGLSQHTIVHR